jgi:hypothetical protein
MEIPLFRVGIEGSRWAFHRAIPNNSGCIGVLTVRVLLLSGPVEEYELANKI